MESKSRTDSLERNTPSSVLYAKRNSNLLVWLILTNVEEVNMKYGVNVLHTGYLEAYSNNKIVDSNGTILHFSYNSFGIMFIMEEVSNAVYFNGKEEVKSEDEKQLAEDMIEFMKFMIETEGMLCGQD